MGAAFAASSLVPFSKPSSAKSAKNASSRSFFDFFLPMMLRYCMRIWKVVTNRSVNALLKIASLYRWRWLALLIPPADSTCDMTNEPSTSGNPGAYDLPARLRSSIQEVRSCDDQSTDWRLLDCSTAPLLDGSTARRLDCHTLTGAVARSSVRIGSTRCRVGFVPSTQGTLA